MKGQDQYIGKQSYNAGTFLKTESNFQKSHFFFFWEGSTEEGSPAPHPPAGPRLTPARVRWGTRRQTLHSTRRASLAGLPPNDSAGICRGDFSVNTRTVIKTIRLVSHSYHNIISIIHPTLWKTKRPRSIMAKNLFVQVYTRLNQKVNFLVQRGNRQGSSGLLKWLIFQPSPRVQFISIYREFVFNDEVWIWNGLWRSVMLRTYRWHLKTRRFFSTLIRCIDSTTGFRVEAMSDTGTQVTRVFTKWSQVGQESTKFQLKSTKNPQRGDTSTTIPFSLTLVTSAKTPRRKTICSCGSVITFSWFFSH